MSLSIPGERNMQKIDFSKLLGFDTLSTETGTDFTDATVAAKLGAKVGEEIIGTSPKGIDFQDETLGAKLGAKVGSSRPIDGGLPDV